MYIHVCVCVLDGENIDETWSNDVKWLFVGDVGRIPEHSGHQRFDCFVTHPHLVLLFLFNFRVNVFLYQLLSGS